MTELFEQAAPDDEGQDEAQAGLPRRRIPLDTGEQQTQAVKRCMRLAVSRFLSNPNESMGRTISSLSSELRALRETVTYEERLAKLEELLSR